MWQHLCVRWICILFYKSSRSTQENYRNRLFHGIKPIIRRVVTILQWSHVAECGGRTLHTTPTIVHNVFFFVIFHACAGVPNRWWWLLPSATSACERQGGHWWKAWVEVLGCLCHWHLSALPVDLLWHTLTMMNWIWLQAGLCSVTNLLFISSNNPLLWILG